MSFMDAVREYEITKDKDALYKAAVSSGLSYSVKRRVLEDTLREEFSGRELSMEIIRWKIENGYTTDKLPSKYEG